MSRQLQSHAGWEASVFSLLHRQLFVKVPAPPASLRLTQKVAVVTGSNAGLGLECCRQLLMMHLHHLILAVRSKSKGIAAAAQLWRVFPDARIEVFLLDTESYDSIKNFIKCCEALPHLNIAILNAGLMNRAFEVNLSTRHEKTLQVNYLSTALLAALIVPVLQAKHHATDSGQLTIVGSDTAFSASFPDPDANSIFQSLDDEQRYTSMGRYPLSKLMLIMFTARLAEHVSSDPVIVNVMNPGFCSGTSLNRDSRRSWLLKTFMATVSRTVVDGARAYVNAAVVKGKEGHGSYHREAQIKP